nr:2-oxo acid dehydrogenase subunit E2 [Sphingomonas sp. Y57]
MADDHELAPLTPLRRIIAARMAEATRTIPHFRLTAAIELDALLALREAIGAQRGNAPSVNAFIVKACGLSLVEVPELNIQWADDGIRSYADAHIAIVTAVSGGLSTPIVAQANRKSVWEIAEETRALAARAARQELTMAEIMGGTFSISNLGMFGVEQFDAIINAPQCAILAVGAARPQLLPDAAGAPRLARLLSCTLSVDHRAIDGTTAAAFLQALRARLEAPACLLDPEPARC